MNAQALVDDHEPMCRTASFSYGDALAVSRELRRRRRLNVKVRRCTRCGGGNHVVLANGVLKPIDKQILQMLAQGLRQSEIAKDLGYTLRGIERRVAAMACYFQSPSVANLIATAIWLSIIDVSPFMVREELARNGYRESDSSN